MTDNLSVLRKAETLKGEVRRLEIGQQDEQQTQRVRQRVQSVRTSLGDLGNQLRLARAVMRETGRDVDLSSVPSGLENFARRAAGGALPSNESFTAAKLKIDKSAAGIREMALEIWQGWARERINALPTGGLALLRQSDAAKARERLSELKKIASSPDLSASDVGMFVTTLQRLAEDLVDAPEAPPELVSVLERLTGRALTLQDLSDEEISLLRKFNIDQEIELRRKVS